MHERMEQDYAVIKECLRDRGMFVDVVVVVGLVLMLPFTWSSLPTRLLPPSGMRLAIHGSRPDLF